jgi:nitrite reductase/ring-hydroxylating ferredoxin subunit
MAFQHASSLDDLPPNSMRGVTIASTPVLLVREGDQVYALEPRCGHMGGPLAEGTLQGHVVTCPWHGSQYDARTGDPWPLPDSRREPLADRACQAAHDVPGADRGRECRGRSRRYDARLRLMSAD